MTFAEMIMLKRAEEQSAAVLKRRWCECGNPVKITAAEKMCMRCRQLARRKARRERDRRNRGTNGT